MRQVGTTTTTWYTELSEADLRAQLLEGEGEAALEERLATQHVVVA